MGRLNPEQFTAPNPCTGYGSLRGILVHILSAEIVWRQRLLGQPADAGFLNPDDFPDLESLQDRWKEEEEKLALMISGMTEIDFHKIIKYTNRKGEQFEQPCWGILIHVVNHGTQHRSEVVVMLNGYGVFPGDLDLIHYLRQPGLEKSNP